ncbi:MAG: hypothetical protein AB7O62_14665 [Pirellulales bacterium]
MDFDSIRSALAGAVRQLAGACGVNLYRFAADRRVLERVILPHLAHGHEFARVLFVGCAWYTQHYAQLFESKEFWTLELDPTRQKFGAKRHIVDSLENLSLHFSPDSLDAIVCNGLLGWGLNDKQLIERAFGACVDCLRPGGVFVLGWDDVELRRPCPPQECASLQRMKPHVFEPLSTTQYVTKTASRHTYDFFEKANNASGQ